MIPLDSIDNLLERSQFNNRRRKLLEFRERLRMGLSHNFKEFEDCFIIDSMPLEICKMARHRRVEICKEDFETAPEKGFCTSQNTWFYGRFAVRYKLHAVCAMSGVFNSIDITKANVHDIAYLKDVKSQLSDTLLLVDRGYMSNQQQLDLFESVNIRLETPMISNQKKYKKHAYVFRRTRKRIEMLFFAVM